MCRKAAASARAASVASLPSSSSTPDMPAAEVNNPATSTFRQRRLGAKRSGPVIRSTSPGTARHAPTEGISFSMGSSTSVYIRASRASTAVGSLARKSPSSTRSASIVPARSITRMPR